MLKVVNLTKKFEKTQALDRVNLDINKGDRIVIIGPSGCGKSTLLRCINGLETPTSGQIIYNGKNIEKRDKNKFRQKVGMVFQSYNLFNHLTVKENITLAPVKLKLLTEEQALQKANELLKSIKLLPKINEYPQNLSGGEKQRIAIVRSLMLSPDILLFDEPTSALDPEMINEVLELMTKIAKKGMTMVVVSHEMTFAESFATRVIFMDEGKIIEMGSPDQIFNHPKGERLQMFLNKIKS
ncbi:MAG: amino acid ABC transporter ATP-binding protein [Bacilli bacterium]|nr:amino acid ABC transporter ATP-binding protein [Bacilli bacterium]MDD4607988.1 amino acid ABC transporter ATP-binding protein [Bacilli bacterium]